MPKGPAQAKAPAHAAGPLEILAETDDYMVIFKPGGLPTQPGTGHTDALTTRLAALKRGAFTPTPAHRLDRDTSGVILVARTFNALRKAHDALRTRQGLRKEYLVWVHGIWPAREDRLVRHYMRKGLAGTQEKMLVSDHPVDGAKEAMLIARPLAFLSKAGTGPTAGAHAGAGATLLQIRLLTGRTHQIRAQLSFLGYPVLGDGKYGRRTPGEPLLLHALRLTLPDGKSYQALPRWQGPYAVSSLPEPMAVTEGMPGMDGRMEGVTQKTAGMRQAARA